MLELGVTFSYGQLAIDNEIASMVKRVVQGSPVDMETVGIDSIHRVGSGKHFLRDKHTLKYMPLEQSEVDLFDRRTRGSWERKGATDVRQRADEMAVEILREHKPMPLDPEIQKEIKRAAERVESQARAQGQG